MGTLASGSMDGKIYTYAPRDEIVSDYARDNKPYLHHTASVEDIQWSPIESFAFASCSVDGTVQICDTRTGQRNKSQILIEAHKTDVNVISWNSVATNLLASGYLITLIVELKMAASKCGIYATQTKKAYQK